LDTAAWPPHALGVPAPPPLTGHALSKRLAPVDNWINRQGACWLKTVQVVAQPLGDHQDMTTWLLAQESEPDPEPWTILNLLASAVPGALSLQIP